VAKVNKHKARKRNFVPVVDRNGTPLNPTHAKHARKLVASKQATPFFMIGIFCIRLNRDPSSK